MRDLFTHSLSNFGDAFNIKHSLLQFQEGTLIFYAPNDLS
jgi:hypothetical protein